MYTSLWGGPTLWYRGAKFVSLPASPTKSLRIILEVRWEPRFEFSVFMICGPGTLECRFISQETEDQLDILPDCPTIFREVVQVVILAEGESRRNPRPGWLRSFSRVGCERPKWPQASRRQGDVACDSQLKSAWNMDRPWTDLVRLPHALTKVRSAFLKTKHRSVNHPPCGTILRGPRGAHDALEN